ncbi:MAG TPA: hypothetical protein VLF89_04990 [Candidatus Saccharimonadales bacterium]|nr:hypothetical protein [Candidatus Saccharimonadales bacterium]
MFIAGDSTLQPGIKVGNHVIFKSSGIVLYTDIPDNMSVALASQARQQLNIEKKTQ